MVLTKLIDALNQPYADSIKLPLAVSPWPMLCIVSLYLFFVLRLGPQFMSFRKPFELRRTMQFYNVAQIIYNALIFTRGVYFLFVEKPYNFSCMSVLPEDHPLKSTERLMAYSYYVNKFLDLFDTVFFVLRKSYKQITVLHVFHHVLMTVAGYMVLRYHGYGGHPCIMGLLNTFVHIVMYTYYYLSAKHRGVKENIWWKKYITILQEVQFVVIFAHSIWTWIQPNCGTRGGILYLTTSMSVVMMIMFTNFYIHSYILTNKQPKTQAKQQ
ncbi:elongation of very long chain fatty acids protein F-like [Scaptodrosophila lebanonensis]|uniref:Elongation of very long chain fatty acids protein n=1 Tax=Drosophila lebanonensis TaxID=7225 RepID=A0A6J2T7D5_DROLE|nr:elongation of very long chain fatty acids protein F-like [Scaptodrosophila lebanonensis]